MHKWRCSLCVLICLMLSGCAERTDIEFALLSQQSQAPWYFLSPQEYQQLLELQSRESQAQIDSSDSVISGEMKERLGQVGISTILHSPFISKEAFKPLASATLETHLSQVSGTSQGVSTRISDSDIAIAFMQRVKQLFIEHNSPLELTVFGEELNEGLAQSICAQGCLLPSLFTGTEHSVELSLLESLYADASSPAQKARQMNLAQRIRLYLTFQYSIFGTPLLNQGDITLANSALEWHDFYRSLARLRGEFGLSSQGLAKVYYADNEEKLFAYQKQNNEGARFYIVFNLSFDIQTMPLPLGFMRSTKVKLWQTDSLRIESFVTDQALMIRPFSAAIVIVE